MTQDNGGPAFPSRFGGERKVVQLGADGPFAEVQGASGMTLRDYFAGQVVASCAKHWIVDNKASDSDVAQWAYEVADAMLAARKGES